MAGPHPNATALWMGLQPVFDGVFHQGLQQQGRHELGAQGIGQIKRRVQARTHANLHEREVVGEPGKLGAQVVTRGARGLQRRAEVVVEVVQHGLGTR